MSTPAPPPSPPQLDPPFRGYIETTYDSLLVFEAARRGLIPRVTRRLIERERGMVQSGAVFVFDEQESGIKRWTDGLVWSPSRILGNFLVYRETDKRIVPDASNPDSPSGTPSRSMAPPLHSYAESSHMALQSSTSSTGEIPILAQGAIRPRSASEGGMDRQKERQLVGSLTNSYKFKEGGLVKKTMSVSIGNYSQHMISYYTVADVMSGKLRAPSTIPELAALEISPDYLQKQNFRFPPVVEVGQDGIPRYRGEAEEPMSPNTPMTGLSLQSTPSDPYDNYNHSRMNLHVDPIRHPHSRGFTHPQHSIPHDLAPAQYVGGPQYFSHNYTPNSAPPPTSGAQPIPIQRQASGGPHRPSSSKSRYDPYGPSSPRIASLGMSPVGNANHFGPSSAGFEGSSGGFALGPSAAYMNRRQSVPQAPSSHQQEYQQHHPQQPQRQHDYYQQYDVKPIISSSGSASYAYQPPHTAPGSFAEYYHPPPPAAQATSPLVAYSTVPIHPPNSQPFPSPSWSNTPSSAPPGSQSRLLPAHSRDYGRLSLGGQRPGSNENPHGSPVGLGAAGPPSSSGSGGSAGAQIANTGGAEFAYGVSSGQHTPTGGGWGRPVSAASSRSRLGQGQNLSPTQAPKPVSTLGLLQGSVPGSTAPPIPPPTAEMSHTLGAMGGGQYVTEDGWGNQAAA